ncbi:hypothetical protein Cgig2_002428 [Carnegiea gigantea]|uniref:RING-type E3 ubiquitin transferase n=1 Tax=Carnegiea gigantea TaxID=171969 RepID=A0A9Q1QPT7_9CARY|nr:hypothetical protein Cgig2_002428 [Carnegiea gigantea]
MASIDGTPLLSSTAAAASASASAESPSSIRAQGLRQAARIIRRASRGLRQPSMAVRETAAQEIEDRQDDWAYSFPIVALDAAWNAAVVAAAVTALLITRSHSPHLPLRLWIAGYAVQCVVHIVCVSAEYRRRRYGLQSSAVYKFLLTSKATREEEEGELKRLDEGQIGMCSDATFGICEYNVFICLVDNWILLDTYWWAHFATRLPDTLLVFPDSDLSLSCSSVPMFHDMIYVCCLMLCIAFLVLDLFFVMFCVALASVIAAAVCCCLPCIIAILYVLADRGGASKEDIELLPKYTFHWIGSEEKISEEAPGPFGGIMRDCGTNSPIERRLTAEDAECCICLSSYEDGIELRELPCGHHFHCACVDKWLYISSTCPLCKYDISRSQRRDEEV